jgi:hypothetical protein
VGSFNRPSAALWSNMGIICHQAQLGNKNAQDLLIKLDKKW